jgi:hypothetical protein
MGAITDVIEVVRARLEAETAPTKLLETVKNVFVGKRQNVDFSVDCPFVIIALEDGTSERYSGQNRKVSDVTISVTIIERLVDEKAKNLYFDTGSGTGLLPLMETALDVVNQTSGGVFDPRLDQNSFESMAVSIGGVEKMSEGFLAISSFLTLKTREYIGNQRRL